MGRTYAANCPSSSQLGPKQFEYLLEVQGLNLARVKAREEVHTRKIFIVIDSKTPNIVERRIIHFYQSKSIKP
jgi:hypothetical protein